MSFIARGILLAGLVVATGAMAGEDVWFPADAVVDVTRAPYGAKPDDGKDDTEAIQKAVTDLVDTGRVLYFPAGVYDVSRPLVAKNHEGLWRAHLTLQGQGRDRTILRLADRSPGFGDARSPSALLATGSHWEPGDGLEGGGNKAFRNNVFDLTLDTGAGNPGAVGIAWAVSNQGALKNVRVRSGDGRGVAGVSMRRRIPGPGFIKNVEVRGFDVGIDVGDLQYGVTLERVTVGGQRIAGIRTDKNLLHIRRLESGNAVPAILVTGLEGGLTLVDSRLAGGAPDGLAIDAEGAVRLRDVEIDGYAPTAVRVRGAGVPGRRHDDVTVPGALGSARDGAWTGRLPVEEPPEPSPASPEDWMAVGPRGEGEEDDTQAIRRAFASGRRNVYFRNDRVYFLSDTIDVGDATCRVLGLGSEISLGAARAAFGDREKPRPLFRVRGGAGAPPLVFETMFFNAQYAGEVLFENDAPRDVVIRHSMGWVGAEGSRRSYRNTARATGRLFIEDVFLPGWAFSGQRVWAWQFNPENWDSDGSDPQVLNRGGRLWVLGFKTEGAAPFIATVAGGATELLGAYNYVSAAKPDPLPAAAVPYIVEDSTAALGFTTENFRGDDYAVYIRETRGGKTVAARGDGLWPRNGRKGDRSLVAPLYLCAPAGR